MSRAIASERVMRKRETEPAAQPVFHIEISHTKYSRIPVVYILISNSGFLMFALTKTGTHAIRWIFSSMEKHSRSVCASLSLSLMRRRSKHLYTQKQQKNNLVWSFYPLPHGKHVHRFNFSV